MELDHVTHNPPLEEMEEVAMTKTGDYDARAARQLVQGGNNWADWGQLAETEEALTDLTLGSLDQIGPGGAGFPVSCSLFCSSASCRAYLNYAEKSHGQKEPAVCSLLRKI